MCACQRQRGRQGGESEKVPPWGVVRSQSLLSLPPLGSSGTHAHMSGVFLKSPGPRLELRSQSCGIQGLNHHTTWLHWVFAIKSRPVFRAIVLSLQHSADPVWSSWHAHCGTLPVTPHQAETQGLHGHLGQRTWKRSSFLYKRSKHKRRT